MARWSAARASVECAGAAREVVVVVGLELVDLASADACCAPIRSSALGDADARTLATGFAALGDPVRLRLLNLLATSTDGAVCVCDLVEPVGKSQPTVSHHLKVLRQAGLVTVEKRGTNNWYAAVPGALEALRTALGA